MGMLKEFQEFALKGNVLDLAVGVIIGGAFGGIVNSMIADIIMPCVGMLGNVDYSNWYFGLTQAARDEIAKGSLLPAAQKAGPVLLYGKFITVVLNFLILAFCIFMVVKIFNTAKKRFEAEKPAPAPAGPTPDQKLLTEIRDLLAKRA